MRHKGGMGNAGSSGSAPRAAVAPHDQQHEATTPQQGHAASSQQEPSITIWQATLDDPIALYTLILAVATTLLWLFTAGLWYVTFRLSRDAKTTAETQADKMERSIEEAGRAAGAMERISESMAINAVQVVKSVEIMGANAEVQRTFGMMNMRAYIDVLIGHAIPQTDRTVFEAIPYMTNSGNTPARNIRWKIAADVLPVPLPDDFTFPLGDESTGQNTLGSLKGGNFSATIKRRVPDSEVAAIKAGVGSALYCWGVISYTDMFKKRRRTEFAQMIYWEPTGEVREDGFRPENVKGYHLERHSRTT